MGCRKAEISRRPLEQERRGQVAAAQQRAHWVAAGDRRRFPPTLQDPAAAGAQAGPEAEARAQAGAPQQAERAGALRWVEPGPERVPVQTRDSKPDPERAHRSAD